MNSTQEIVYSPQGKEHCQEGDDYNSPETRRSREQLDSEWETSVKMALVARDLMLGNPRLATTALLAATQDIATDGLDWRLHDANLFDGAGPDPGHAHQRPEPDARRQRRARRYVAAPQEIRIGRRHSQVGEQHDEDEYPRLGRMILAVDKPRKAKESEDNTDQTDLIFE